jgi:hypothetical protein
VPQESLGWMITRLRPALPDLPRLATELSQMVETAEVIYTDALDEEDDADD